jgi:hypothetical protein
MTPRDGALPHKRKRARLPATCGERPHRRDHNSTARSAVHALRACPAHTREIGRDRPGLARRRFALEVCREGGDQRRHITPGEDALVRQAQVGPPVPHGGRRPKPPVLRGALALLAGFTAAIILTLIFGLAIRWSGRTPEAYLLRVRPVSNLSAHPQRRKHRHSRQVTRPACSGFASDPGTCTPNSQL